MSKEISDYDDIPVVEDDDLEDEKKDEFFSSLDDILKDEYSNNNMQWKSKETLDKEAPQFSLLPSDDYKLAVSEVELTSQKKYMKDEMEEVVNVKLEITSFKDGSEAVDVDGKPLDDKRRVFFTIRPNSMGFMRDGTPAKSRAFVAYATGQDINGDIALENWDELKGKEVYAEIVQYKNQKGQERNKISRILPPPRSAKKSK